MKWENLLISLMWLDLFMNKGDLKDFTKDMIQLLLDKFFTEQPDQEVIDICLMKLKKKKKKYQCQKNLYVL